MSTATAATHISCYVLAVLAVYCLFRLVEVEGRRRERREEAPCMSVRLKSVRAAVDNGVCRCGDCYNS